MRGSVGHGAPFDRPRLHDGRGPSQQESRGRMHARSMKELSSAEAGRDSESSVTDSESSVNRHDPGLQPEARLRVTGLRAKILSHLGRWDGKASRPTFFDAGRTDFPATIS